MANEWAGRVCWVFFRQQKAVRGIYRENGNRLKKRQNKRYYKAFDWHKECETLEEAIECLEKEFDEIVKLAIEMQEQHDAVIRKAIQEINRIIEARKGDCVCQKS